jgi:hypothetical protein
MKWAQKYFEQGKMDWALIYQAKAKELREERERENCFNR